MNTGLVIIGIILLGILQAAVFGAVFLFICMKTVKMARWQGQEFLTDIQKAIMGLFLSLIKKGAEYE